MLQLADTFLTGKNELRLFALLHSLNRCIRGLLSEQYVILVTHQLQYVKQCDTVLVLKEVSPPIKYCSMKHCEVYVQGKQFLYGDTSVVLGEGQDILELIGEEKEDPRLQYGTRKYSVVRNGDDENPLPDGA